MSMNSFHSRQKKPRPVAVAAPLRSAGGMRVDAVLVALGLAASRTAAQRLIAAGRVSWDGVIVTKSAQELPAEVVQAPDGLLRLLVKP